MWMVLYGGINNNIEIIIIECHRKMFKFEQMINTWELRWEHSLRFKQWMTYNMTVLVIHFNVSFSLFFISICEWKFSLFLLLQRWSIICCHRHHWCQHHCCYRLFALASTIRSVCNFEFVCLFNIHIRYCSFIWTQSVSVHCDREYNNNSCRSFGS